MRPAMVHVSSHARQRHKVFTVMALASVSMTLPSQNGHFVGRAIDSWSGDSGIVAASPRGVCVEPIEVTTLASYGTDERFVRSVRRCRLASAVSAEHLPDGLRQAVGRRAPEPHDDRGGNQGEDGDNGPAREGCGARHVAESADGENPRHQQRRFQMFGRHVPSVRKPPRGGCSRLHNLRRITFLT